MEQLSIFVSGVSSQRDVTEVRQYFQRFGRIRSVKAIKRAKISQASFKLMTADLDTYQNILNFDCHSLDNRLLQCQPFFSGRDLKKANQKMNHRRTMVKNVPAHQMDEQYLRCLIEANFGKVSTIFKLKKDTDGFSIGQSGLNQSVCAFSVLFDREEDALLAKKVGWFYSPMMNLYIPIEGFKYQKPQTALGIEDKIRQAAKPKVQLIQDKNNVYDYLNYSLKSRDQFLNQLSRQHKIKFTDAKSDINCHFTKPTQRQYHQLHTRTNSSELKFAIRKLHVPHRNLLFH